MIRNKTLRKYYIRITIHLFFAIGYIILGTRAVEDNLASAILAIMCSGLFFFLMSSNIERLALASLEKGYTEGYWKGCAEGHMEGYEKGCAEGHGKGYAEGYVGAQNALLSLNDNNTDEGA